MIRKGSRISQINGRRKINTSAKGQHSTKRINQRKIAIKVFINGDGCSLLLQKINQFYETAWGAYLAFYGSDFFIFEHPSAQ